MKHCAEKNLLESLKDIRKLRMYKLTHHSKAWAYTHNTTLIVDTCGKFEYVTTGTIRGGLNYTRKEATAV